LLVSIVINELSSILLKLSLDIAGAVVVCGGVVCGGVVCAHADNKEIKTKRKKNLFAPITTPT